MSLNPITDTSVWIRQQAGFYPQTSQVTASDQGPGGNEDPARRVYHHHGGGMGHALMQTLKQLLQSLPPDVSAQSAAQIGADLDRSDEKSQANAVRTDMHNFMHALFQAIRSQGQSSSSNTSPYPPGFDGSKFESGLSSLISQLAGDSGSGGEQISYLQTTFNTLVQDLQNGPSSGSAGQASQSVTLQDFLTMLRQNLVSHVQVISARGNVVNVQG